MSYAAEVIADNSGKFCGNSLRFATEHEAQEYVRDLDCGKDYRFPLLGFMDRKKSL